MATGRTQRIGIWIIAVALTVGTLAGFIAIILAPGNQKINQDYLTRISNDYQVATDDYQKKVDAQALELSGLYFPELNKYSDYPTVFEASTVAELKTEDLKTGTGLELTSDSSFSAYYIGWTPDGKVFDSSISDGKLKAPILVEPGGVIEGWSEGVVGMKEGGIRLLTIPSEKAYGASGAGETIPPNTPLKFIVMIIPTPEPIIEPEIPADLLKYYSTGSI